MFLKYKLHIMLLIVALSIFPEMAWAQNLFTPVDGDKSIEVLSKMFGKLGVFGASDTDAFASVISAFNSAVLVIGGVLVAYTIFIGTIGTAHDGEMMGKKFSSAWVPIRTALGTAVVLPIIEGSYCVMQAIVGWLIVQGVGLADLVWKEYMTADNITKQVALNASNMNKDYSAAWGMFSSAVCMYGYEKVLSEAASLGVTSGTTTFGMTDVNTGGVGVKTYNYGASNPGDGFKKDSCGTVAFGLPDINSMGGSDTVANPTGISIVDLKKINELAAAAAPQQMANFEEFKTDINKAAKEFVDNPSAATAISKVKEATAKYSDKNNQIASSMLGLLANFDELKKSSTQDGWMLAGAWYMRMSYLMDSASKLMGSSPSSSGAQMDTKSVDSKYSDEFMNKYGKELMELTTVSNGTTGVGAAAVSQSSHATSDGSGLWDFFKSGANIDKVLKNIFLGGTNMILNDGDHPIMAMKGVGNWLLAAAAGSFLLFLKAMAAIGLAQGSGVALSVSLLPFTLLVWPSMFAVGVTLSFVLPMMPFLIWIGVVLGWLILCVEAIIAAPVWAVMHLSPHGDDMVGTGSQGYRLVLSLMLRPVLMIFGLIAALTMITVVGKVINEVFASVFLLSQQDSNIFLTLANFIIAPFIYCGMMWTLITKTMSIIHVIPDQLLQWFGGGGAQLGDYGNTLGGQGSQTFAAAGAASSMGGRALSSGKEMKDLGIQAKQRDLQAQSVDGDKTSRAVSGFFGSAATGGGGASALQSLVNKDRQDNPGQYMNKDGKPMSDTEAMEKFTSSNNGLDQSNDLKSTIAGLGGEGSPLAQDFSRSLIDKLNDPSNAGSTFSDIKNQAMSETLNSNGLGNVARLYSGMSSTTGATSASRALGAMVKDTQNMTPAGAADAMNTFAADVMKDAGGNRSNYQNSFNNLSKGGIGASSTPTPPAPPPPAPPAPISPAVQMQRDMDKLNNTKAD